MVFEAVYSGDGYMTAIAIDDVSFSEGCAWNKDGNPGVIPTTPPGPSTCDDGYYSCVGGGCYEPAQRCDFFDACNDGTPPSDEAECGENMK